MPSLQEDRLAIRELVESWVVWRDACDWERFRGVWHDDGRMMATWFQGSAEEFIEVSKAGFERGFRVLHFLGGCSIDCAGDRAVAQTKMTINQRALVHEVLCDVVCTGRFYDFLERRAGRWGIVLRQPIYEKDRLDPVDPAARLELDPGLLGRFPEGYRHLAYLQAQNGYDVKRDMPGLVGPEVEALYARGEAWLRGGVARSGRWRAPRAKMLAMTTTRIFELRTYHSAPGRLEALSSRFRDHTMDLFARHQITVEGFWSAPQEGDPSTGTLVYVCSYPSREAASAAWQGFMGDPEWVKVRAETEADGALAGKVESLYMEPTDYSPMR